MVFLNKPAVCVFCFFWMLGSAGSGQRCPSADMTGDCRVDFADLEILADRWILAGEEELTGDSHFNFNDYAVLATQWMIEGSSANNLILVHGGTFQMGDSLNEGDADERPVHAVTLSSFYMSPYETTNGQYCEFLNSAVSQGQITITNGIVYQADSGIDYPYCDLSTSSSYSQIVHRDDIFSVRTKGGRDMSNDPMVRVSWFGAVAYCNWRSQQEGLQPCYNLSTWECDFGKNGYHLPTEAQWEYAARGGLSGQRFPWGDTITHSTANYWSSNLYSYDLSPTRGYHPLWNDGTHPYTSPVGIFGTNGYGLYDMAGNVWEWCNDLYGNYSISPKTDPTGSSTGNSRVFRGGGWSGDAHFCRVAIRGYIGPRYRHFSFGFRVCNATHGN